MDNIASCSSKQKGTSAPATPSWCSSIFDKTRLRLVLGGSGSRSRTEQAQAAADKRMLLFWPWFVECAFQQHYNRTTLGFIDTICLPLDVLIWFLCVLAGWHTPVECLCSALPLLSSIAFAVYKHQQPDRYRRRRTVLTAFRRFLVMPYLSLVLLRRPLHVAGRWQSAFLHLFVLSGSMHTIIATFFFLNNWWTALFELALAAVMLGAAAPTACSNVLAGPRPHAGWQAAAALMDKAALNIYSRSLQNPQLEHAVCCSTLNTVLVACSCLAAYLVHWFERQQRLRYKAQLPPAVAAMQGHLYALPPGLVVAQAVLLLLHPAMVVAWITCGAWHGLMTASGTAAAGSS